MTAGPGPAGPWLGTRPLLLASASPARRALLESAGFAVDVEISGVDERALERDEGLPDPAAVACRLAEAKAASVAARHPDRVVIGADQVLACGGDLVSKAGTVEEASRILARLSGRAHALVSAVAIARHGRVETVWSERAALTMRALDDAAIGRYLTMAGAAATRSVGAYEIEGLGIHLFERLEGDHSTILGLPMLSLLSRLRDMGLVTP